MKKLNVLLLVLLFGGALLAKTNLNNVSEVEDNLMIGLQSDNLGLKTSSAYYLGEYGSSKSVNALMSILKNGKTEEERISAAVALTKINSEKALFAVKQRAQFDESERVRKQCALCYQESSLTK
ncbi:MAG: HEAT repeat domain-containing protein [Ignavibacteriae bacterium]|nr:HEAT repeat domain-containing protein [Ignavibacteriota bacterium]